MSLKSVYLVAALVLGVLLLAAALWYYTPEEKPLSTPGVPSETTSITQGNVTSGGIPSGNGTAPITAGTPGANKTMGGVAPGVGGNATSAGEGANKAGIVFLKGVWDPGFLWRNVVEPPEVGVNSVSVIVSISEKYEVYLKDRDLGRLYGEDAVKAYRKIIREAKRRGYVVFVVLEYVEDVEGEPSKRFRDLDEFLENFKKFSVEWASICEELGVDYYSPINELDQVLKENGLETGEILEIEEEFYSEVVPRIREKFTGKVYCKLGSVHWYEEFNASLCDVFGVIIAPGGPDVGPEEFRDNARRIISLACQISEKYSRDWIIGEVFIPRFVVKRSGAETSEYFRVVAEELEAARVKPKGFFFFGYYNPFCEIDSETEEIIRGIGLRG